MVSARVILLVHVMVLARVVLIDCVMVLAHVMVLADVIVLIYIWLDDYLTVESHCIFSNKTYHHVETLQCLK